MASGSQHRCVFVGNIPYDATEEQLVQICEEVGPVVSFRLVVDRETGKPKGYGFCEYKDEETALSARRNLQGYKINGRQLRVDFAENDKGPDRNREQGRGGPGLASNAASQKPFGGNTADPGNSSLHWPIGIQSATAAASAMAGALGGLQTGSGLPTQNGFQATSGLGTDPLTQHLAKMSRAHLHEILTQFKAMATTNKELARQLLLVNPLLPKALFQAEIILGMVSTQVLQMPNLRQTTPGPTLLAALNVDPRLAHGQISQSLGIPQMGLLSKKAEDQAVLPVNLIVSQSSSTSLPPSMRSSIPQYPRQAQSEMTSANLSTSSMRTVQPFTGHGRQLPLSNSNYAHSATLPLPSSQTSFQPASLNPSSVYEMDNRITGSSVLGGPDTVLKASSESLYSANYPSKLRRLEDGHQEVAAVTENASLLKTGQEIGADLLSRNSIGAYNGSLQSEKQVSQVALPPEVESALLQQVMSLTPEQLSSLSPEQQQQVLQLQQMLR